MAAPKRKGLGKGLEALIRDTSIAVNAEESAQDTQNSNAPTPGVQNSVVYIDIDEIKPNPAQPRTSFTDESIETLAASVRDHGVIQPVIVRKRGDAYELVAGERRLRAARKAQLRKLPAIVRELSDEENALFAIIENMQREDLNPIEEAQAFSEIMEKYGMTHAQLAVTVGRSRPYISNTLRTLKLPDEVREALSAGELSLGHANAIGAVKEDGARLTLARQIIREGLSVREAEAIAAKIEAGSPRAVLRKPRKSKDKDPEVQRIEDELTSALGARVSLKPAGKGGEIIIKYYSPEELDGLIALLEERK